MASILQEKSKDFALQIIKVCNEIKLSKRESVLSLNSPKIIQRYLISLKIKQILRKLAKTA